MAWLFYFEGIAIFHVLFEGPDLVMQKARRRKQAQIPSVRIHSTYN